MNLDLYRFLSLITIVSFLSIVAIHEVIGQDLEEVSIPINKRSPQTKDTIQKLAVSREIESTTGLREIVVQKSKRDPDTYRKEAYIHTLLRHTYYHKLTTSPWSRYLQPKGWQKDVVKWRYWDQLKSYITGNDHDILILREPIKMEKTITTSTSDSIASISQKNTQIVIEDMVTATPPIDEEITPKEDSITPLIATMYDTVLLAPWMKEIPTIDSVSDVVLDTIVAVDDTDVVIDSNIESDNLVAQSEARIIKPISEDRADKKDLQEPKTDTKKEVINTTTTTSTKQITIPASSTYTTLPPSSFGQLKKQLPWPVSNGRITDRFGTRKNAEARGLSPNNYGVDMLCSAGSTVKAVHGGTVLLAKRQSPYDIIVTVKHGDYTTAYYYLINSYVKQGEIVQPGQSLGQLRTSVEEADFHFEIWFNQERLDPELWLK